MKRLGGIRRNTRSKYKKHYRSRGKIKISSLLQTFKTGDRVGLGFESAYFKGIYHPRFYGKVGAVQGKKGSCYEVAIKDIGKEKTLIVHPIHLRRL